MSLITGTDNADTLIGTDADDTIIGAAGDDYIDGGGAFNIVAYWTSPFGIVARLFANIVDNDGFGGRDTLNNINGIAGTGFDDLIYGSQFGNYIQGFAGNDTIFALGGDDLVRVSEGDDSVDGGEGTDRIYFMGARSEYTVTAIPGGFQIVDNVAGRDGTDIVLNFEQFQFTNTRLSAAEILDPNAPGDGVPYPPPGGGNEIPVQYSGFAPMTLELSAFGAGLGAGGWQSDNRYPRHLADVNGDGSADIIGFGELGAWVALADGSGGFGSMQLRLQGLGANVSAGGWTDNDRYPRHFADVNGDGRADIVGFGEAGAFVALADGTGSFGPITQSIAAFGAGQAAGGWTSDNRYPRHLADVNGDGQADIVGFGEAGAWVALADGSGGFGSMQLRLAGLGANVSAGGWTNDDLYARRLADVNGDGRADIVGFGEAGVFVALADGTGGFGPITQSIADFGVSAAAGGWTSQTRFPRMLADVNGDGRADIVGFGDAGTYVALADGSGGFNAAQLRTPTFGSGSAAGGWASNDLYLRQVADVNNDGRADIVGFGEAGVLVSLSEDVWA